MTDCNETGGVDTRVQFYRDWIESQMVAGCENGVRVWCDEPGILGANYFEKLEAEQRKRTKGSLHAVLVVLDESVSDGYLIGLLADSSTKLNHPTSPKLCNPSTVQNIKVSL